MTLKELYPKGVLKRRLFKDYNYELIVNDKTYYVFVLDVNKNSILSINSKYVWEVKYGKPQGANFKTTSTKRIDTKAMLKYENRIVVFKGKPYKILQYINESEVQDITNVEHIFTTQIVHKLK